MNEVPSERDDNVSSQEQTTTEENRGDRTQRPQEVFETTVNSETSFMPGQGAVSSTPATARVANPQESFASQSSEDASWTQSPLVKLSQELKTFSSQPEAQLHTFASAIDSIHDESSIDSIFQQDAIVTIPSSAKGKGKDTAHPMLKNVLRHNLSSVTDSSAFDNKHKATSPLKFKHKPKTPIIDKRLNPYLPPSGSSANWSGIVDLRDTSVLTPRRKGTGTANTPMTGPQSRDDTDDDSFDGLPPGMSPLVLMSPVRPPRSSMELGLLKLRQTPVREASERIQRDLITSALKSVHKSGTKKGGHHIRRQDVVDSSMSTVPTPPSLSRYARRGDYSNASSSMSKDPSLESMIRHIRQDIRSSGASDGVPGLRLRPKAEQQLSNRGASPSPLAGPSHPPGPATPMYGDLAHHLPDNTLDSDSDSLDSINNTAHPSAAFLMASGGAPVYDDGDSFGSSNHSSDSLENEDVNALGEGIAPVHPFARNAAVVDDGFDDDDDDSSDGFEDGPAGALGGGGGIINDFEEETVFGSAPAQRQSTAYDGQSIRMLGEDLLQDTIGIGAQIVASGRVEESPTPANWGK